MIYYAGVNKETVISSTEKCIADLRKDQTAFGKQYNDEEYINIIIIGQGGKIFSEEDLEEKINEN